MLVIRTKWNLTEKVHGIVIKTLIADDPMSLVLHLSHLNPHKYYIKLGGNILSCRVIRSYDYVPGGDSWS